MHSSNRATLGTAMAGLSVSVALALTLGSASAFAGYLPLLHAGQNGTGVVIPQFLLLVNGTSKLLLVDGTSKLLLN